MAAGLLLAAFGPTLFGQAAASAPAPTATPSPTPAATAAGGPETDQPIVLQQYVVTGGFASSLLAAEQAKQDSNAITEDLAPEDLGKLPYISIADALATLTGLASQRVNGRDQEISIRGLGPDFQVGTMDGVEQATTNDNRAVEYDQYPANLIGGVTVYKTGRADMVGGIGGTIDLHTLSPLGFDHRVVSLNYYYDWSGFQQLTPGVKNSGQNVTLSYIDQFANGTEGIYFGYAHTENPHPSKEFQAWGYPTADAAGDTILGGSEIWATADLLTRDAGVLVWESQPTDWVHSKVDLMYTKFKEDEDLRGMQIPMAEWSSAQLQPGYTVSGGAVTRYTLTNVQPVLESLTANRNDHLGSAIWNLDLGEKSPWPVHLQAGYSEVHRTDEDLESYAGLGFNGGATDADTLQVVQNSGQLPQFTSATNYANAALFTLTDPQGWGTGTFPVTGQEGYLKYFNEHDIVDSVKLFATHDFNWSFVKTLEVGASVTQRYKQQAQLPTGYLVNSNGTPHAPLPPLLGTSDLSFIGNIHPIAWNGPALLANGTYTFEPNPNLGSFLGDAYKVWETVTRPYVQFDLDANPLGIPMTGNIGGVVDVASQSSDGFLGNGGNVAVPSTGGANYATFLPSLNLIFKLTQDTDLRFSAGRQEARPPMYEMRAGSDYGYNQSLANSPGQSPWSGTNGNPGLRPWLSNSVDLSLEHYFGHGGGYIALAGFDKDLLSYIYQQNTVTNFTGYYYTGPAPQTFYGYTSEYQNGVGGHVSGAELTVQLTSELLSGGAIHGFGLTLNGTLADSSIQPWGPGNGTAPLDNLSKKVANATLYYEYHGLSLRVSENYRSATREYITTYGIPTPSAIGTPNDGYSVEQPEHTIEAHVGYEFEHGPLTGLTVYVEGQNLNNEPLITYNNGNPNQMTNWQTNGATYDAGFIYKF